VESIAPQIYDVDDYLCVLGHPCYASSPCIGADSALASVAPARPEIFDEAVAVLAHLAHEGWRRVRALVPSGPHDHLDQHLRKTRAQLSIVLDEFGGTAAS
jgi:hypothetical protein